MTVGPGRVYAHVGQAFPEREYDVLVVGGGRLGLACAFYLRRFEPSARVLVVERGGVPSEGGAAAFARGVWGALDLPPAWRARAEWVRRVWADPGRETGTVRTHDPPFRDVGLLDLRGEGDPPTEGERTVEEASAALPPGAREAARALVDFSRVRGARFDARAGVGSAGTLALAYGHGAVRLGADLLLNTEARLRPGGAELRRLDITRAMEVVVAETRLVRAREVVVAAGSEGPALLEADLGALALHGRAFAQFPRLRAAPPPGAPLVRRGGFLLRPDGDGWRVVPPSGGPDPAGYAPTGARLLGVPVGARREVVDALLSALDDWPAFAGDRLDLGKTPLDVPGGWEARPQGGWPRWERVAPGVTLLLGGPESDRAGPAVALDLAAHLAGAAGRPWDEL